MKCLVKINKKVHFKVKRYDFQVKKKEEDVIGENNALDSLTYNHIVPDNLFGPRPPAAHKKLS